MCMAQKCIPRDKTPTTNRIKRVQKRPITHYLAIRSINNCRLTSNERKKERIPLYVCVYVCMRVYISVCVYLYVYMYVVCLYVCMVCYFYSFKNKFVAHLHAYMPKYINTYTIYILYKYIPVSI